jgi:hypothetical protein
MITIYLPVADRWCRASETALTLLVTGDAVFRQPSPRWSAPLTLHQPRGPVAGGGLVNNTFRRGGRYHSQDRLCARGIRMPSSIATYGGGRCSARGRKPVTSVSSPVGDLRAAGCAVWLRHPITILGGRHSRYSMGALATDAVQ